jgi:hypothetical protein
MVCTAFVKVAGCSGDDAALDARDATVVVGKADVSPYDATTIAHGDTNRIIDVYHRECCQSCPYLEKSVAAIFITVGAMTSQVTLTIRCASSHLSSPVQSFSTLLQTAAHMSTVGGIATIDVCDTPL